LHPLVKEVSVVLVNGSDSEVVNRLPFVLLNGHNLGIDVIKAGFSVSALYKREQTSKIASITRIRQKTPTKKTFFTLSFPLLEESAPVALL
jgi:hypothetical protein